MAGEVVADRQVSEQTDRQVSEQTDRQVSEETDRQGSRFTSVCLITEGRVRVKLFVLT